MCAQPHSVVDAKWIVCTDSLKLSVSVISVGTYRQTVYRGATFAIILSIYIDIIGQSNLFAWADRRCAFDSGVVSLTWWHGLKNWKYFYLWLYQRLRTLQPIIVWIEWWMSECVRWFSSWQVANPSKQPTCWASTISCIEYLVLSAISDHLSTAHMSHGPHIYSGNRVSIFIWKFRLFLDMPSNSHVKKPKSSVGWTQS